MPAHLVADPAATTTPLDPATAAGWLALSAAVTEQVPDIADREDLIVTVAPGAGHGAPACFLPTHAAIEVDGVHLGAVDPATATPASLADRTRYATAWGLLTHECAHARHTRWAIPPDMTGTTAAQAALLLEESRIEAAQIGRRPDDRHWLRASATALILTELRATTTGHGPAMTEADAAQAAGLLLARADAGILTPAEVAPVTDTVTAVLGPATLAALRQIWRDAHHVADDDTDRMIDLGRAWCHALGTDPSTPATEPPALPSTTPPGRSPLADAVARALAAVTAAVAAEPGPADPAATTAAARESDAAARARAARAATRVFTTDDGHRTGSTAIAGTRPPTAAEHAAARRLARALSTAGIRAQATVTTASPLPPGRLRMRGALAADAQRAAGAIPTAQPFTRTTRRTTPAPPLRLGIACDVSGSMCAFAAPVASAAWILARAAHLTPVPATTATVVFGHHVRPITHPGTTPIQVTEFRAEDNYEDIPTAVDALDAALDLSTPGPARLLVVVSDGNFRTQPRRLAQTRIDRLTAAGCAVLWLAPAYGRTRPLDGVTVHPLNDPTTTAHTIGRAATTALRNTQ